MYKLCKSEQSALRQREMEQQLQTIVEKHGGLWSAEAEQFFLEHCADI